MLAPDLTLDEHENKVYTVFIIELTCMLTCQSHVGLQGTISSYSLDGGMSLPLGYIHTYIHIY